MSKTTPDSILSANPTRGVRVRTRLLAGALGLSLLPLSLGSTAVAKTTNGGLYEQGARVLLSHRWWARGQRA